MANMNKHEIFKLIIGFLIGSIGELMGVFVSWLMVFFLGGAISAEKYLRGLRSRKCLGLSVWEFMYFTTGWDDNCLDVLA